MRLNYIVPLLMGITLLLAGCGASLIQLADTATMDTYKPSADESTVIFICCGGSGGGRSGFLAIYDVEENENKLAGILRGRRKIAYKTKPGKHLFMVVHRGGDFLSANLQGGKTYFVNVVRRWGGFSLKPVHKEHIEIERNKKLRQGSPFVELVPESVEPYLKKNAKKTPAIKKKYLPRWKQKSAPDSLQARDGI